MRSTWTDSRLDDFAKHTDQRFDAVDRRFDAGRSRGRFARDRLRGEIGGVQRPRSSACAAKYGHFSARSSRSVPSWSSRSSA